MEINGVVVGIGAILAGIGLVTCLFVLLILLRGKSKEAFDSAKEYGVEIK